MFSAFFAQRSTTNPFQTIARESNIRSAQVIEVMLLI